MFKNTKKPLRLIYWGAFLFANHIAFTTYINSSFLSDGCNCSIPENLIGLLYTTGSIVALVALAEMPKILNKLGNKQTLLRLLFLDALALIGLLVFKSNYVIAGIFIGYLAINTRIAFSIDVFVEHYSEKQEMGDIRGIFLTVSGLAWLIAPFITGWLIEKKGGFHAIYLIGLSFVALVFLLIATHFKKFQDPVYSKASLGQTLLRFWKQPDLRKIFMSAFTLQFFYAWMVIYTPIYLSQHIGLPWSQIGIIFTIMLTPFVLFEIPLGVLADKKYGEKEILSIGLVVMGISTIALALITSKAWWIWALVLFATRTGASAVQVMTESYFFKHVEEKDVNFVGVFRDTAPLAYLIAPLVATVLLSFFNMDFKSLFVILGIGVITSLFYSLRLHDTK